MSFTFNRLGQQTTITDGQGTRTFTYNATLQLASELVPAAVTPWTNELIRVYDSFGRPAGFSISSPISNNQYQISYSYDPVGRFHQVDADVPAASLPVQTFQYTYLPGSDLIHSLRETNTSFSVTRTYEPNRNLITQILNTAGTNSVSQFDYANDAVGRRTRRLDSASVTNAFDYNARSELIDALMGTNSHSYRYDPIGNRQMATNNTEVTAYAANALNQYTNITDGVTNALQYDFDGNLVASAGWTFSWDAENRLVLASNATTVVSNSYDYMSRRIGKSVYTNDSGSWILASDSSFTYDGWAMIREVGRAVSGEPGVTNYYVYGLDLSGTLQGAGTIGGILGRSEVCGLMSNVCYYCYDGNGNVSALVDGATGNETARYEYGPFGEVIRASGAMAEANPFRFSTKYEDAETGLLYYGSRFYNRGLGRWLSRDPIQERGGLNVYVFVKNDAIALVDPFGMQWCTVIGGVNVCIGGLPPEAPPPDYPPDDGGGGGAPDDGGGGGACVACPASAYPVWGPKIKATPGGTCNHKYRTTTDRGLPKTGNGCGTEGGLPIPDSYFWLVDFTDCCNGHDVCYATCGNSKTGCDASLGACMAGKCNSIWYLGPLYVLCLAQVASYPVVLTPVGWFAYEDAQDANCEWKPCCK